MKKITKSIEDYLEAILFIEKENKTIHSIEIAKLLGVSKPAVSRTMQELLELKYIEKKSYGSITLTDLGREIAEKVLHKHETIKAFLLNLGISDETAERDCCLIEHVISDETLQKFEEYNKK